MSLEIERKFLVHKNKLPELAEGVRMSQGYIDTRDNTTVRVRVAAQQAFLTLKGPSDSDGLSRLEFEYPVPLADAQEMLEKFCRQTVIEKTRFVSTVDNLLWEIDVFKGANAGLIVAEVELASTRQQPVLPEWVAAEVTGDHRYYNSSLLAEPWQNWPENR